MAILKELAAALAAVVLSTGTAQAEMVLNEWVFNPLGQGFDAGQYVYEYLDTNGTSFFQIERTGGTLVTFREHRTMNIVQADSNGQLFPVNYPGGMITATLEGYGVGELGGAFRYTGGNLRLFQYPGGFEYATEKGIYGANLGRLIGNVQVSGGGGKLDASGILAQGEMSALSAQIVRGDLESGYFFRGNGSDLALVDNLTLVISVATTYMNPQPITVSEIACQFAGFKGPGCDGTAFRNAEEHYFLATNGQLKLGEVPEPGSLALFGVALFAVAAGRRRSAALKG